MSDLIDLLSKQQLIWKGRERQGGCFKAENIESAYVESGYDVIDERLGGLPRVGVLNINAMPGIGELRLLVPALLSMQGVQDSACSVANQQKRVCVFINPPGQVCAEFLYHQGFDLKHVLVIKTKDKNDALWAAEACAKSGACCAVLLWHNFFEVHHIKRLQLACEEGDCLQVLLRSPKSTSLSLPVSLSVRLTPNEQGLNVNVMKRKGGWPISEFALDMSQKWPSLSIMPSHNNVVAFPLVKTRIRR